MHIQLEAHETHTIQSYSETEVTINNTPYQTSFILNKNTLITPWNITRATELNQALLEPLLVLTPDIIILGVQAPHELLQLDIIQNLRAKHIGVECMNIGAACRTFNLLLGEHRAVALGIILNPGSLHSRV
jgi:uncharacterized protein